MGYRKKAGIFWIAYGRRVVIPIPRGVALKVPFITVNKLLPTPSMGVPDQK